MNSTKINRRFFLKLAGAGVASMGLSNLAACNPQKKLPNVILIMADDQGWGDTGYNGHPYLKTPTLDSLAANGVQFNRFYSAAPVCSPTRGSCLTGRHPFRYGIYTANAGHMKKDELTLAEVLKGQGYVTGHFGKWHLGTLTKTVRDANRGGPRGVAHYSPPWENGFDVCFSTESKVPTWDPMVTPDRTSGDIGKRVPGEHFETYYWTGPGQMETENLSGDDSRVIMDRAVPFVKNAVNAEKPFFMVVWFHAPHLPVLAGPKYRNMYKERSLDEQHFYGCITALDEQVGRLREQLQDLGVEQNTMIWYCSDNGPEGRQRGGRTQGTTKGLKGRKRSLHEGGIRVPGLFYWPEKVKSHCELDVPACTIDLFPTILSALMLDVENKVTPIDGLNLLPIINREKVKRSKPIGFQHKNQLALIDDRYKLYSENKGETWELYDIVKDPDEDQNIIKDFPNIAKDMVMQMQEFSRSCKNSDEGNDY